MQTGTDLAYSKILDREAYGQAEQLQRQGRHHKPGIKQEHDVAVVVSGSNAPEVDGAKAPLDVEPGFPGSRRLWRRLQSPGASRRPDSPPEAVQENGASQAGC